MHRRRMAPEGFNATAAILVAGLLLLLGGLGLAATWYFVVHSDIETPAPRGPRDEVGIGMDEGEIPFDQPTVDAATGEWVMELEAVWQSPESLEATKTRARACQDFLRDGSFHRLYPEASKVVRLQVQCFNWPHGRPRYDLKAWLDALQGLEVEVRHRP